MASSTFALQNAAVLHGAKDLRIEQRPVVPPQQGQAQVKIVSTGLCGSDLHYYTHGRNGDFVLRSPLVLGHESAGIVTSLGQEEDDSASSSPSLRVGQRVALEVGIACKTCRYCIGNDKLPHGPRYNLCENMRFCSSAKTFPHLDGTLQASINHPVHLLHPIPDSCTYEMAALAEPLCVVLHASRRANFASTQNPRVCVIGCGAVGLLAASLSLALGASYVAAIDIDELKLDFAKDAVGVSDTWKVPIPVKGSPPPKDKDEALQKSRSMAQLAMSDLGMSKGDGFDVVFECTGVESCIQMSIFLARPGSRVALVGMGTPSAYLPISAASTREVDLVGVFRYANCYPEALRLLGSGKLKGVDKMVTQRFGIEDTDRAFETLRRGRGDKGEVVVKVMVGNESRQDYVNENGTTASVTLA